MTRLSDRGTSSVFYWLGWSDWAVPAVRGSRFQASRAMISVNAIMLSTGMVMMVFSGEVAPQIGQGIPQEAEGSVVQALMVGTTPQVSRF